MSQEHHESAQIAGSVLIGVLAALVLAVAHVPFMRGAWKDTLIYVGLYLGCVVTIRMVAVVGYIDQIDARVLNGLIAGVFASAVVVAILEQWYNRQCENRMRRDS